MENIRDEKGEKLKIMIMCLMDKSTCLERYRGRERETETQKLGRKSGGRGRDREREQTHSERDT